MQTGCSRTAGKLQICWLFDRDKQYEMLSNWT